MATQRAPSRVRTTAQDAVFKWKGMDRKGQPMKGELRATSEVAAREALRRQGIRPSAVSKELFSMAQGIKPKEIALAEKQTRETRAEEERLGRAIATGMVIIERGSQGVVMTAPPKTAAQIAREKHNYDCFKGRDGLGWADAEDSEDEYESDMAAVERYTDCDREDAW